jgi:hypothetical protein
MSQPLPRRSNPGDVVNMRDIPRLAKAILGCEAGGVRNAASSVGTLRCCAVSPMWFSSAPRPTPRPSTGSSCSVTRPASTPTGHSRRHSSWWQGALIGANGDAKESLKQHSWRCPRKFGKTSKECTAMPTGYGSTPNNIDWESVESHRDGVWSPRTSRSD